MDVMPGTYITWRRAVFAIGALFVVSAIASRLWDFGGPRFSEREEALLRELEPRLNELLISEHEVPPRLGDFYDCASGDSDPAVQYDTKSRESGSVDVRGAEVTEGEGGVRADVELCGEDGISWISAVVSPQTSKDDQLYDLRVETELSRGKSEDLESVVRPLAEWDAGTGEVLSIDWVETHGLGNAGWGFLAEVRYPDGTEVSIYDFDFTRSVVGAGVHVRLPAEIASKNHAVSIARAFDNKIKARLELLSAATRAE